MKILQLKYTNQECLELLKDVYQKNYTQEIKDHCRIIAGCAKARDTTLEHAFKICLKLQSRVAERIRYCAAYQFLTNANLTQQQLKKLKDELLELNIQSGLMEIDKTICKKLLGYRRTAIYNRAKQIRLEIAQLQYAQNNISNIEITAQIIQPNKPAQNQQRGTS